VEDVRVMFRWQKLTDARGRKWEPCTIRHALKVSGYAREFVLSKGDTDRFWKIFILAGIPFAFLMASWPWMIGIIIGSTARFSFFAPHTQALFWFHLVMFGGIMGGYAKFYSWRSPKHAVAAMTRAGLCPACAYNINEIQPDPDGCTVCPECGAAWRMSNAGA